jgi:Na+/H+ antiporter NhaD/arsenite permease-like protein
LKIFALVLFIATYVVMIAFPSRRPYTALISAAIFVISGIVGIGELPSTVNWNVLFMIAGTMITVFFFIDSKMPDFIADVLMDKSKNVMWLTIYMSLFAGIISAFIDNVATVLMVAPVGLAVCRKMNISPVNMILAIAVSSNLQGAATLVGDTTSILLGDYASMDFLDFFWMNGKPGIFFAVEIGALVTVPIMMLIFRKDRQPIAMSKKAVVKDYVPTFLLCALVLILIGVSFIKDKPQVTNGVICMAIALISIVYNLIRYGSKNCVKASLKSFDYETILLLLGLFVVIAGVSAVGIIDDFARIIAKVGGNNQFLLYTIIVWGSVLISAFIDNIPYVATMLPVLTAVTASNGMSAYLMYFGLLCGATLGGNLTPIGASANITGIGILKKEGYNVSFGQFAKIGIPFTLAAVLAGYLFIWIFWH